jgi:hypothetical protein
MMNWKVYGRKPLLVSPKTVSQRLSGDTEINLSQDNINPSRESKPRLMNVKHKCEQLHWQLLEYVCDCFLFDRGFVWRTEGMLLEYNIYISTLTKLHKL